ncbi:MAG: universal stress protein [Desulfobacteraceae bacterium]|nr:universal stress protein [Desulfobacteraceae bacterium]
MKILVGYKGVNLGKDLLKIAVEHAKAFKGEVLVVTSMIGGGKAEQLKVQKAEENLEKVKNYFDEKGLSCQTHLLVRGLEAGDDIVNFAKEKGIEEIIIGVKRRSKVGKLLFGSTAQAVILQAECPVVVVK